jgi:hypothetical protein
MQDLSYIFIAVAFFGASILYTNWLEKLRQGAQDE